MTDFYKDKRVVVTGCSGLTGYNLTLRLLELGARVLGVVHKTVKVPSHPNFTICGGIDLRNPEHCDRVAREADYVFHLAANTSGAAAMIATPLVHVTPNVVINAYLLEACHTNKVKKFLWLASTTGYPDSREPMTEDMLFVGEPHEKYFAAGWMKRYTEILCRLYSEKISPALPCIVLRPTNIYGPGDKIDPQRSHVLPALIRKVIEKQNPIEVWGDGTDERDLIYIDDMVDAMLKAMEIQTGYDPINIGYGQTHTVNELLQIVKEVAGYDAPVKYLLNAPRTIPVRKVNIEKSKRVLGWEPLVSIQEGIRRTHDWMTGELGKAR